MKRIEKYLSLFVYILSLILCAFLSVKSLFLTTKTSNGLEFPTVISSNLLQTILSAVVYLVVIFFLVKLLTRKKGISKWLLIITVIWIFVISFLFINSAGLTIFSDQADIYSRACDLKCNNYSAAGDWYLHTFPYQTGMVLYEKIFVEVLKEKDLLRLCTCNAIISSLIVFVGYKIIETINKSEKALVTYLLFMATNAVLIIYCAFVYNDIISILFCMLSIWMFLLYMKKRNILSFVINILFITIACIFRLTSITVLIAEVCILLVKVLSEKNIKLFICTIITLVLSLFLSKVPIYYANAVYGLDLGKGMPYNLTIAMGMQNDEYPGWYNDYNYSTYFFAANEDRDKATEIGNKYINERLGYFSNHLTEAFDFYDRKISSQWFDGTYQCYFTTFDENTEKSLLGNLVYYGNAKSLLEQYMDSYQFIIYALCFVYVLSVLNRYRKTKEISIEDSIVCVILIGGFLFSIIWESKGRYILPYYVFMIILASIGFQSITKLIDSKRK